MKNYLILSLILLFFSNCQKEENCINNQPDSYIPCEPVITYIPEKDTCYSFPPEPAIGWDYENAELGFNAPDFNPNNPDEFLFLKGSSDTSIGMNMKVNVCTGEQAKIFDYAWDNPPRWGKNDWIVFVRTNDIYKVKSNGDSLQAITSNLKYYSADWILNGESIFCTVLFPNIGTQSVILNIDGNIIDTLPDIYARSDYLYNKIATSKISSPRAIGYLNLPSKEFVPLLEINNPPFESPSSIQWLDDKNIIWTDIYGVHKINIDTGIKETIVQDCSNRKYSRVAASPSKDGKILLRYTKAKLIPPNTHFSEYHILLFDVNTKEQWIVDL